jgi:hypothetical protein
MAKYVRSKSSFGYHLDEIVVNGKVLPSVDLPKAQYRPGEVYINGPRKGFQARPILEVTPEMVARIEASPQIVAMFANGQYEYLDTVPESMQTSEDLVANLRAENAALKNSLETGLPLNAIADDDVLHELKQQNANLKARLAQAGLKAQLAAENAALNAQLDPSVGTAEAPPADDTPAATDEVDRGKLMAMKYADLRALATSKGVANIRVSRAKLVEDILTTEGYQEADVPDGVEETADQSGPAQT